MNRKNQIQNQVIVYSGLQCRNGARKMQKPQVNDSAVLKNLRMQVSRVKILALSTIIPENPDRFSDSYRFFKTILSYN